MSKTILIPDKILPISSPPLNHYALIIEGDKIVDLETISKAEKKNPYAKRIVLEGALIMPGLINLHTHLELTSLKGSFPEGIGFFEWIYELINRKKKLEERDYKDGVNRGIKELISTGTTSVGEITSEGISPYILRSNGIRGKVFYEIIGPSEILASHIWAKKRLELKGFKDNDLIQAGLSPHSCYSLSLGLLKRVSKYSLRNNIFLSSHISETKEEGEFIRNGKGQFKEFLNSLGLTPPLPFHAPSPTAYFKDIGLLRKDLLAVHAVWVDEKDIEMLKESSVSIAHCPRSNAYLNVGKAPLMKFLKEGINVGLGTDSLASNHSLNMWDEMRMAYRFHRKDGLTPYEIFRMTTINGARALGLEEKVGSLEVGKKADIIALKIPQGSSDDIYLDLLKETKEAIFAMVSGDILYSENMKWN